MGLFKCSLAAVVLCFLTNKIFSEDPYYSKIGKRKDNFYSQESQDKYLFENHFKNKTEGIFIDIGAHNGISYSNTKFFEELGWKGICVEPIPEVFDELRANRSCICIQGCVSSHNGMDKFLRVYGEPEMLSGLASKYDPRHRKRVNYEVKSRTYGKKPEVIDVQCYLLNEILEKYSIEHVDFLSIDTEGNELEILRSIDFERFDIHIISIENNYKDARIGKLLKYNGYKLVKKLRQDEVYLKNPSTVPL